MKTIWQPLVLFLVLDFVTQNHVGSIGLKRSIVDSSDVLLFKILSHCDVYKDLTDTQREICHQEDQSVMGSVTDGVSMAQKECAKQFKNERWNCSIQGNSNMLGRMTDLATKEAAFNYALVCAGIIHVMARDCMKGILKSCHCSRAKRPNKLKKDHKWGGCGDNVGYAMEFSRKFLDDPKRDNINDKKVKVKDSVMAKRLMDAHNNEAGRQAVLKYRSVVCKCHGVTNNCQLETCWYQVREFEKIGEYLKKKYAGAFKAKLKRKKSGKHALKFNAGRLSRKEELVYVDESPDYCSKNLRYHSLGTVGRQCNPNTKGTGSCKEICCGRRYKTERKNITEKCSCNFVWCCIVKCETCSRSAVVHTCL